MCTRPIKGYRLSDGSVRFSTVLHGPANATDGVVVSCGKCIECKLKRRRYWTTRLMHEYEFHDDRDCHFITLTYDDEHLPWNGSIRMDHWQKFKKRLDKKFGHCRFYMCGEYGTDTARAHYHFIAFGLRLPDLKLIKQLPSGDRLYNSESLTKTWGKGFAPVGTVTRESCSYVAGYITKKLTGAWADCAYRDRVPPFSTMSRRPGIGTKWIEKYIDDVYGTDGVVVDGKLVPPPTFYDRYLESIDSDTLEDIKEERRFKNAAFQEHRTKALNERREKILERRAKNARERKARENEDVSYL